MSNIHSSWPLNTLTYAHTVLNQGFILQNKHIDSFTQADTFHGEMFPLFWI